MRPLLAAETISEWLEGKSILWWEIGPFVALVLSSVFHAFVLLNLFGLAPFFFIWLERKVSGRIQDRLGPTRVGGKFGWLQSLADGIKLIQKEDLIPSAADGMLYRLAPYLAVGAAFSGFMFLPFADGWAAVVLDVSLFTFLAIISLEVVAIILAGYSSGSKWSLFGGMREAAQMVSYEIPVAICALIPIVSVGSLNLMEIARMQEGWFFNWMLFHDPFTFLAFFAFFTVATANVKRAPFDLAEAESELVGGFHTEYSGMRWSFFFLAEYASMFAVSAIAVILFLGGWYTGIAPIDVGLLGALRGWNPGAGFLPEGFVLGNFLANVIAAHIFIVKASLLVFLQIWVRWTFPRLRIDQVMVTGIKYLLPISCFLFLGAAVWPLVLAQATGRTHWGTPLGDRLMQTSGRSAAGGADASRTTMPPLPLREGLGEGGVAEFAGVQPVLHGLPPAARLLSQKREVPQRGAQEKGADR